jgi:nucleoside 2-deoxyribosyltransferase
MKHGRDFLVYLAGPIAGLTYDQGQDWRAYACQQFPEEIRGISPLRCKEILRREGIITIKSYSNSPLTTDKGITTRDTQDCSRADALLVNLLGAKAVSFGTPSEFGMAHILRIPIVVVIEDEGNPYDHPMMRDMAGFRVNNLDEGIAVIEALLMPEGVGTARELPLEPIREWNVPVLDASQRIAA